MRSQDAVAAISRGSSVLAFLASGALNFVIVPDNTQTAAYVEPAKECSYIIHLASPLPTVPGDLVSKAVAGTRAILEAAEATLSIKRVIFTLSTASLRPFERLFRTHPANQAISSGRSDEVPTITANTMVPTQPPLPDEVPGFHKYVNSKVASRNLVHDYATAHGQKDLHFSIVNIMPGWIFGPEELTRTKAEAFKGSNQVLAFLFSETRINPLLGLEDEKENAPVLAESVHLDDVVEGHVKALDIDGVPGHYQNFLFCSEGPAGPTWMNAVDIVRKDLSDEVAEGLIPLAGKLGVEDQPSY